MKLLIIQNLYKSVNIDGRSANDLPIEVPEEVHSLQFFNDMNGIIFNKDGSQMTITTLPEWAIACVKVFEENVPPLPPEPPIPPAPTPEELNKQMAIDGLYATDWTASPYITDPEKSSPYLKNQDEFFVYRNQLREIAINPPVKLLKAIEPPKPIWSDT